MSLEYRLVFFDTRLPFKTAEANKHLTDLAAKGWRVSKMTSHMGALDFPEVCILMERSDEAEE